MYLEQPPGFEKKGKENWVMKLFKSIYGMKQASRVWNQTFNKAVESWGFKWLPCEWCIYHRHTPTGTTIFVFDDIISASSSPSKTEVFRNELKSVWEISDLGLVKYALRIAITRDSPSHSIFLSQTTLIDRVVEQFGQKDAHPANTPMVQGLCLDRPDKASHQPNKSVPYQELVGSLMYIANATRPDIAFTVGCLASVMDCYTTEHWKAAVRVLRYLKGTRNLTLHLGGTQALNLTGFSNSDYANCINTSRSIGGYCFSLGGSTVSWSSRKQRTVADSSCYAEYIALSEASQEAIFLRMLLEGVKFPDKKPSHLYCDNDAAIKLAEDQVWHSKGKHIRVKYHYVRDQVLAKEIKVNRVRSKDNPANIFTKALGHPNFLCHRTHLGLVAPTVEENTTYHTSFPSFPIDAYHTIFVYDSHHDLDDDTSIFDSFDTLPSTVDTRVERTVEMTS